MARREIAMQRNSPERLVALVAAILTILGALGAGIGYVVEQFERLNSLEARIEAIEPPSIEARVQAGIGEIDTKIATFEPDQNAALVNQLDSRLLHLTNRIDSDLKSPLAEKETVYTWVMPPPTGGKNEKVPMIPAQEGFCYLSSITTFAPLNGQQKARTASVEIGYDKTTDYWFLEGDGETILSARARCLHFYRRFF